MKEKIEEILNEWCTKCYARKEYADEAMAKAAAEIASLLGQAEAEIARLAKWILKHCPQEIGAGDRVHGESAVDVAIRLLEEHESQLAAKDAALAEMAEALVAASTSRNWARGTSEWNAIQRHIQQALSAAKIRVLWRGEGKITHQRAGHEGKATWIPFTTPPPIGEVIINEFIGKDGQQVTIIVLEEASDERIERED